MTVRYTAGANMINDYANSEDRIGIAQCANLQDGWMKINKGKAASSQNRGQFTVSTDADPCGVFSMAITNRFSVHQPLRNRFTNGVVRGSCDMWIPTKALVDDGHVRFRLETEDMMDDYEVVDNKLGYVLFEAGINLRTNTGTLRCQVADLGGDGKGNVDAKGGTAAAPGNWVRVVVEADLDSKTTYSFRLYDLGSAHPTFETVGTLKTEYTGRHFLRDYDPSTMGGITGFAVRTSKGPTLAYYGKNGYDDACAFKVDNLKVEWKAPGASEFQVAYLNDFATSKRRTLSPAGATSVPYDAPVSERTETFSYSASRVREYGDYKTPITNSLTPVALNSTASAIYPQPVGYDGWRRFGQQNYQFFMTTNSVGRMAGIQTSGSAFNFFGQLIGEKITNGAVKAEMDIYVPPTLSKTERHCGFFLAPEDMWHSCHGTHGEYQYYRAGISCKSTDSDPTEIYPHAWAKTTMSKTTANKLQNRNWYRVSTTVDLDKQTLDYAITLIGPEPVTLADTLTNEVYASAKGLDLRTPAYSATMPDIGTLVIYSYAVTNKADQTAYCTNFRVWKDVGTANEKLVYQNDFTTRKTTYSAPYRALASQRMDRMFEGIDGWQRNNNGTSDYVLSGGKNPVLLTESGDGGHCYLVQPLGRSYRSGDVQFQVDMKAPDYWILSSDNWMRFEVGNDQFLSGSVGGGADAWNSNMHFYLGMGHAGSRTACDTFTASSAYMSANGWKTFADTLTTNHWYRFSGTLHISQATCDCAMYDMGVEHPEMDTPLPPKAVKTFTGAGFTSLANGGTREVSAICVACRGACYPFARWLGDRSGTGMIDNIKVWREDRGEVIILR